MTRVHSRGLSRQAVVGLVLSGILVVWIGWKIDLGGMLGLFGQLNWAWLVAVPLSNLSALLAKGLRWRLILGEALDDRPRRCFGALFIGYFGNAVLPAKLGEFIRIQVCRRHNGAPFARVLATVVLERSLDALVLAIGLALTLQLFPLPRWVTRGAVLAGAASAVLFALLIMLTNRGFRLPVWALRWGPMAWLHAKLRRVAASFVMGLSAVRSRPVLGLCLALTVATWLLETLSVLLVMRAFGLSLSYFVALMLVSVSAAGVAVPSAPSGVGTHQFLYIVCLGWFGVTAEQATAVSVAVVTLALLTISVLGVPSLLREGVGLHLLRVARAPIDQETSS